MSNPLKKPQRRQPKQQRSKETVRAILEATIDLLEDAGYAGVTMQKIADRAGINVAAVYSYFSNKYQVLAEINERQVEERYNFRLEEYEHMLARGDDWLDVFAMSMRNWANMRMKQRGSAALRRAMHASPILWELSQQTTHETATRFAERLESTYPGNEGKMEVPARIITETMTATFDLMQLTEDHDPDQLLEGAIKMVELYMKSFE